MWNHSSRWTASVGITNLKSHQTQLGPMVLQSGMSMNSDTQHTNQENMFSTGGSFWVARVSHTEMCWAPHFAHNLAALSFSWRRHATWLCLPRRRWECLNHHTKRIIIPLFFSESFTGRTETRRGYLGDQAVGMSRRRLRSPVAFFKGQLSFDGSIQRFYAFRCVSGCWWCFIDCMIGDHMWSW